MATEILPDDPALRFGRRQRAFEQMEAHDLDVLVMGRTANMRYVSGVPLLWNAGTRPFGPGCVAVRATGDVYLLSTWDEGVPEEIPHENLYGITWNPMNYVKMLKGINANVEPRRVGTDAMSPLFAQLLPMAFPDAELVDAGPAIQAAKRVKTAEEIEAIRAAVAVADACIGAAISQLQPGVSERELTAVFMDAMASRGVTTPGSQDVARVTSRRRDGAVRDGDLVCFSGGVVAEGYTGEVGRTWPVGEASHDAFARFDALRGRLLDACQPGAPGSALLDAYAAAGEPLPAGPVARGLGLGFDDPVIVGDLPATAAHTRLEPGTVMVVTVQAGPVIGQEPVVISAEGPHVLSSSPFWNADRS
ncbi:MAG: aminopeptidase P family protein [Actinobacteria bacterium]|nr:aminopeptidase P family protein [Actinomycetota bacterium]